MLPTGLSADLEQAPVYPLLWRGVFFLLPSLLLFLSLFQVLGRFVGLVVEGGE